TPDIELNGVALVNQNGIMLNVSNSAVRGLAINRFPWNAIVVRGNDHLIECCHLGTDLAGTAALGNGVNGVLLFGDTPAGTSGNQIGPDNLIAFKPSPGVGIAKLSKPAYPTFTGLSPDATTTFPTIDLTDDCGAFHKTDGTLLIDSNGRTFIDNFGARLTGTLPIGTAGAYTLSLPSLDDGARIVIDGVVVLTASHGGPTPM